MTNRSLGIERVFNLGDYKSLRVSDTIDDLPIEVMFNDVFMDKVRYLQLVAMDLTYERYVEMTKKLPVSNADRIVFLEEERLNTMSEIKNLLSETFTKENE